MLAVTLQALKSKITTIKEQFFFILRMGAGVRDAFPPPMCVYGCSFVYWWNGRGIGRGGFSGVPIHLLGCLATPARHLHHNSHTGNFFQQIVFFVRAHQTAG